MPASVLISRHALWYYSATCYQGGAVRQFRCYSSDNNRQKVEILATKIESTFKKSDYLVDLLGAYRRGDQYIKEATFLIVAKKDDQVPLSPHWADVNYKEKAANLTSHLVAAGVLEQGKSTPIVTIAGDSTIPVNIHYASTPSRGSAQLYLTGDESFIRFLKVMAMEAGLVLTEAGLWKPLGAEGKFSKQKAQEKSNSSSLPPGIAIQSMDGEVQESEGDRRMRETRKQMGLPEGLDLSLDLGSGHNINTPDITLAKVKEALNEQLESKSENFELVKGKVGNEHDIFDALGLVWLPPAMRYVKEPSSKK